MIFKRFSIHRKNPELCNIREQEMLKSSFFSKNKNFQNALLEDLYQSWLFHFYSITI